MSAPKIAQAADTHRHDWHAMSVSGLDQHATRRYAHLHRPYAAGEATAGNTTRGMSVQNTIERADEKEKTCTGFLVDPRLSLCTI
eukprot:561113-Rhodomonas_salina.1